MCRSWYRLKRILAKLTAQLKDAEHKITSRFISDCIKAKADTIVIGDIKGIRKRAKFSKKSNQKVHQWAFARLQFMICYKAELAGLKVKFVSEAYTSQTCPRCGNRKKLTVTITAIIVALNITETAWVLSTSNKVSGFLLSPVTIGVIGT